ncbi:MAG TPA: bifunctional DNA-formamidopyrimidine glycosylase/DNA-(apurinic or apyrimidinic site) lyase [Gaiellaceae bacterium]
MPELPEVETVRRTLAPVLTGRTLKGVRIDDARLTRPYDPVHIAAELQGERVTEVGRRGKYLIVRFASGRALLVHLRMTGSFHIDDEATHERAVATLDDRTRVSYRDVRRFGTWLLLEPDEVDPYLDAKVGEEPLDALFTVAHLGERLEKRRAPIKAALLDQRTLAGLGNIYTDEALWWARIHPLRAAESLTRDEVRHLHRAIRRALERGIARQGADLGDGVYRGGRMQKEFKVYGRADEPCDRCGTPIAKTRVGGRGTWFCPNCQAASSSSSRPSRSRRHSSV